MKVKHGPHPRQRFPCDQCDYTNNVKGVLIRHKMKVHGFMPEDALKCNLCDFVTWCQTTRSVRDTIARHMRLKHGNKADNQQKTDFQAQMEYLKKLKQEHEDEQTEKLVDSDEDSSNLNGIKDADYDNSNPSSTQQMDSTQDENTAQDENRFKCNDCSFKTRRKDSLKRHLEKIHGTTAKNEKCDQCDYITFSKATLNRHRAAQHSATADNVVRCNQCDFVSMSATHGNFNLRRHIKSKHGDTLNGNQQENDTPTQMDYTESADVNSVLGSISPHFMSQQ